MHEAKLVSLGDQIADDADKLNEKRRVIKSKFKKEEVVEPLLKKDNKKKDGIKK